MTEYTDIEAASASTAGWSRGASYRMAQRSVDRSRGASFDTPQGTSKPQAYSGGCTIKGNRSRRGEWIYHLPGMPYYHRTQSEEIFCSKTAAYRKAIVR